MTAERLGKWIASASPDLLDPLWRRFRSSPLSVRLAKGVFWSFVGAVISRGLGVASAIVVARLLGMTPFGEFTVIQSTVGLFGAFAGLGLGITGTKFVAELRDADPVRCGRIIGLIIMVAVVGAGLAAAALIFFAPWFASNTLAAPQLSPLLQLGSALVLFGTLQGVYSGVLGGFEAFKRSAQVNWIAAALGVPLLVLGTLIGGLRGAVIGSVLQLALGCLIAHVLMVKVSTAAGVRVSWTIDVGDWGILWRFSLPAFLSSITAGPANWICTTLLANQDQGYREVAVLNAAGQWKNFLSFLPLMMTSVLVPMFANLHNAGRHAEFRKLLRRNLLINVGACLCLALPLALFAQVIMNWYGPGFQSGSLVFILSMCGTAVVAANNLLSRAMQATGNAWIELSFSGIWAVVLVISCSLLVPAYKAVGLAVAHILAAVLLAMWQWLVVRRLFARL